MGSAANSESDGMVMTRQCMDKWTNLVTLFRFDTLPVEFNLDKVDISKFKILNTFLFS